MNQYQMFINGKWVDAEAKETYRIISPVTKEVISVAPYGDARDVQNAILAPISLSKHGLQYQSANGSPSCGRFII